MQSAFHPVNPFVRKALLFTSYPSDLSQTEKRLARMALLIIGVWLVTWTPYAVIALMQEFGAGAYISPRVSLGALMLAKVSAIVNTFIYGLRYE